MCVRPRAVSCRRSHKGTRGMSTPEMLCRDTRIKASHRYRNIETGEAGIRRSAVSRLLSTGDRTTRNRLREKRRGKRRDCRIRTKKYAVRLLPTAYEITPWEPVGGGTSPAINRIPHYGLGRSTAGN